ncbi:cell division protein FtsK, partial [Lactococcus lactis subsp. lactis]|nr:cell division protein FtsK [Lactococcus lactis subsp. lactis]
MAKRTITKGSRLKLRDKYDREFFVLITGLLVASPVGFFYKNFETLPPKVLAIYAVGILLIAFSVAFGLLILLYHKFLFFSKNNYKRLLLNYVVKHGLVEKETVKDEKGSHEKLKLAPIYLKQPNTYELHTYF